MSIRPEQIADMYHDRAIRAEAALREMTRRAQAHADWAQRISLMLAEDKSNDWSEELAELYEIEKGDGR